MTRAERSIRPAHRELAQGLARTPMANTEVGA
ncbi:MAG: hypothetical protein QOF26_3939 [Baekduia sp.]|jgi:hypothetical protein|nr:hypothetical protein [Baekduia sp.]MDX6703713.1 hypothetical protein [Baekduia sp.]